ncbi:MAG: Arachidonate 15-lipoxygenase [Myxococcales bacterium]|nr:Arachidonate 15-lipoxygenase [Myxococcales bacterium]
MSRADSWDWLFILLFAAFAMTSALVDPLAAFHVALSADSPCPIIRSSYWWASFTDPLWLIDPPWVQVQTGISVFIYGPFYLLSIYAWLTRGNWIRIPSLVFAGALAVNTVIYTIADYMTGSVAHPIFFLLVNLPYFLLPCGLVWRFSHRVPFAPKGARVPSLPQDAKDPIGRARWLQTIRAGYEYLAPDYRANPLTPIAVAAKFPFSEQYGLKWALPYLPQLLASVFDTAWKKLTLRRAPKLRAYIEIFSAPLGLPPPAEVQNYRRDCAFARNRIDGPNPLLLQRVIDAAWLAAHLPISDEQFKSVMGPERTLADELRDGNLFAADYTLLEQSLLPPLPIKRDTRWREKYMPAPVALFCQRPGVDPFCSLVPVAILIDQNGARDPNPLYLRGAGDAWELAKTYVEIAEFNLQAMSSHLYRHHYLAEPFSVSAHRQLSPNHPLYVLLEPHLAYTLAVNSAAFDLMKKAGSVFDEIYAGELSETRQIMITSYNSWTVRQQAFDADIGARGVAEVPAEFPWRDDSRLWLAPIRRFVDSYVRLWYRDDEAVRRDWELQAFVNELQADDGGRLRGLLATPRLDTLDALIELLAQFLFTTGPGHAAVHYPQSDYFTYIPAFPGAAYLPPPENGEPITQERLIATLPPFPQGADQFQNNQIANYRYDRFGDYSAYSLSRVKAAAPAIAQLQRDLEEIERTISERNSRRARPYLYVLPSLVPNSINI